MSDYIVFTIGTNLYAIEVTNVERIVQIPNVTPVVNAHPYIDGMMVYEHKTTKILNFRKTAGMSSQEEEMAHIFEQVLHDHEVWVDTFKEAVVKGDEFKLTFDPHACRLGKWLDSYSTHDPQVIAMLQALMPVHARLHELGHEIMAVRENDPAGAVKMLSTHIDPTYQLTTGELRQMIKRSDQFAKYQQKLIIYHGSHDLMAVKVDGIDDIAMIDESSIKAYDHSRMVGGCMQTRGIVEHKGKLVIVVDSISLPKEEAL